jgi:stage V sporulation protein D (sporulation-specific penicillin-binding protein)
VIAAFLAVAVIFSLLAFRIGYIQVVATDTYASRAAESQVKDQVIPARRGAILDRNMKELAVSSESYTVYLRLAPYKGDTTDEQKRQAQLKEAVTVLSEILNISPSAIESNMETSSSRVRVARDVDKGRMDLIEKAIEEKGLSVIEAEEKSSRDYPLGAFAAHVLGTVNIDGHGQAGVEQTYDRYLSGQTGRSIANADARGNPISFDADGTLYDKKDGLNVVTTIDQTIQYHVEEAIKQRYKESRPKQIEAIVLEPQTGDVLAMAKYPEYDPNEPYTPLGKSARKEFEKLDTDKQSDYLNEMWRNPVVSDLYEPGSVFKLITASAALEEGAVTEEDGFNCSGEYQVEDRTIHCHVYPGAHGWQTVKQAVGHSCNPALVQMMQRMGYDKYSKYLDLFGVTRKTGIDLPAEAESLTQSKAVAGPVGLATMSFGMGLNVTPIETISAVNSIVNGGKYLRPRVVKALSDDEGNIVKEFPPQVLRQVLSEQTTAEVRNMMEFVTEEGGGYAVNIPGYRIGTKTGTAQKIVNGKYSDTAVVCSMLAAAPMEDPQFIVLVVVDDPRDGGFGSTQAGPAVREITDELLRYLNIKPSVEGASGAAGSASESAKAVVPKVKGMSVAEAKSALQAAGLKYSVQSISGKTEFKVAAQYPKEGSYIEPGGFVYLYDE